MRGGRRALALLACLLADAGSAARAAPRGGSRRIPTALLPCARARTPLPSRAAVARMGEAPDTPPQPRERPRAPAEGPDDEADHEADASSDVLAVSFSRIAEVALSALLGERWRSGAARRSTALSLAAGDSVRRLALDWPHLALGSARGDVLVTTLSDPHSAAAGPLFAARAAHSSDELLVGYGERGLLGSHDTGALTAVALEGGLVVSGGRDGCARVWRLPPPLGASESAAAASERALEPLGCVRHAGSITAVCVDSLAMRRSSDEGAEGAAQDEDGDEAAGEAEEDAYAVVWTAALDGALCRTAVLALPERPLPPPPTTSAPPPAAAAAAPSAAAHADAAAAAARPHGSDVGAPAARAGARTAAGAAGPASGWRGNWAAASAGWVGGWEFGGPDSGESPSANQPPRIPSDANDGGRAPDAPAATHAADGRRAGRAPLPPPLYVHAGQPVLAACLTPRLDGRAAALAHAARAGDRLVVAGLADGSALLLDGRSGETLYRWRAHDSAVRAVQCVRLDDDADAQAAAGAAAARAAGGDGAEGTAAAWAAGAAGGLGRTHVFTGGSDGEVRGWGLLDLLLGRARAGRALAASARGGSGGDEGDEAASAVVYAAVAATALRGDSLEALDAARALAAAANGAAAAAAAAAVAAAVSAPGAAPAFVSLCGHASPVVSMQGVAHAGCVVSGSQDGSVRAWDARSGAALWLVDGLTRNVGAICVDEAGRRLLSDGAAEDVVVFDFAPDFSVALRDEQPP